MPVAEVEKLPEGIDGLVKYNIVNRKGSFRCINTQCPFHVQFGVTNTRQFKNGSNNDQACSVCGDSGEFVACTARRYVKYGKRGVQLFHCGKHTCPVTSRPEKPTKCMKGMIKKHSRLKPAEIQSVFVMSSLQTEEDWEKVEKKQHSCSTENGFQIKNKVSAKKSIQVVKSLKWW